jgi:hypothetical protein
VAGDLQPGKKWRKEGGVLPLGSKAFIADDEDRPAWVLGRACRPPAASRLGGDRAVCHVAREVWLVYLVGGDIGRLNRPGQSIAMGRPSSPIQIKFLQNYKTT